MLDRENKESDRHAQDRHDHNFQAIMSIGLLHVKISLDWLGTSEAHGIMQCCMYLSGGFTLSKPFQHQKQWPSRLGKRPRLPSVLGSWQIAVGELGESWWALWQ